MNKNNKKILNDLLDYYGLKGDITFIQHRNLKEFRHFKIERINPNHRIKLYGILKDSNKKKEVSKQLIEAGEILIGVTTITANLQILIQYSDLILLILSCYILNCFLFYFFGRFKLWGIKKLEYLLSPLYSWYSGGSDNITS